LNGLFRWCCLGICIAFVGISGWFGYTGVVLGNTAIYLENGPLENVQAFVLAGAAVLFLRSAFVRGNDRLNVAFCAWLCLAFVLREVDVEDLDVHHVVKLLGAGIGRNLMLATMLGGLFLAAAANVSRAVQNALQFLKSLPGKLLLAGGAFLVIGDIFEKMSSIPHHIFMEEIAELAGFCLMLLSALATQRFAGSAEGRMP
jgi:hypothetical protein